MEKEITVKISKVPMKAILRNSKKRKLTPKKYLSEILEILFTDSSGK